jgi:lysophospholipase L1-like esterase
MGVAVNNSGASPALKPGARCSHLGAALSQGAKKYLCVKSHNGMVWQLQKVPAPITTSTTTSTTTTIPTPMSISAFADSALTASQNASNQVPSIQTTPLVSVEAVTSNPLPTFVNANSVGAFATLGPPPLVGGSSGHDGSYSMQNFAGATVYPSNESNSPPWAISFTLTTIDPQGRFVVETSAQPISIGATHYPANTWRLAYKTSSSGWTYQSVSGISHQADGTQYRDLVSMGRPGAYDIRLEFDAATTFYGVGIDSKLSSVSSLPELGQLKVMVIGDSWVAPDLGETGPYTVWDAFPGVLSWLSGWNVISDGTPGQGYLQQSAGGTYANRIKADIPVVKPNVVILTGSGNDLSPNNSFTYDQISTEVVNDIEMIKAEDPGVLIILCSPFQGPDEETAKLKSVADNLGVPYIDFIGENLFNGSNISEYINGHPTKAGSIYIATQMLKQLASL